MLKKLVSYASCVVVALICVTILPLSADARPSWYVGRNPECDICHDPARYLCILYNTGAIKRQDSRYWDEKLNWEYLCGQCYLHFSFYIDSYRHHANPTLEDKRMLSKMGYRGFHGKCDLCRKKYSHILFFDCRYDLKNNTVRKGTIPHHTCTYCYLCR